MKIHADSTNDYYLIKYLSTSRGQTPRYFGLHAADPREAVAAFRRLFPRGIVVDVFPPPVPPQAWA